MMQQGLMSLPGAGQGQGQAPGQAAPMAALPQQQPRTPAAMTGRLEGLPPQQLMMMFTNPADTTPKWAVVTAYAKAIEQQRMMDAARGQSAMQQGQAQMGQPPVAAQVMMQPPTQTARHGGIMHGYSGGGAVAFAGGGANSQEERDRQAILNALSAVGMGAANLAAAGVDVVSVPVRTLGSIYNTISRGHRAFGVPTPLLPKEATMKGLTPAMDVLRRMETPDIGDETERLLTRYPKEVSPAPAPTPAAPPSPGIASVAPPGGARTSTSASVSMRQRGPAPTPAAAPAEDPYASIEKGGLADIKAYQDMLRGQGAVDPELAKLREAAYQSATGIASRRERDRLAALEEARKAASTPLLENTEALLNIAGAIGGAKRFGDVLTGAAGAAGKIKGEQRKTLEAAQKVSREEQAAIEQLNQAVLEKKVADKSGDVDRQRQADAKVAEAQLKVSGFRTDIQKQRDEVANRAEQRAIEREKIAAQLQAARIAASARESGGVRPVSPADYPKYLEQATDNINKDPRVAGLVIQAKSAAQKAGQPFDENAFRDQLIRAQYQKLIAAAQGKDPFAGAAPAAPTGGKPNDPLSIR